MQRSKAFRIALIKTLGTVAKNVVQHVELLVRRREVNRRTRAVILRPKIWIGRHDQLQLLGIAEAHRRVECEWLELWLRRVPPGGCSSRWSARVRVYVSRHAHIDRAL